MPRNKDVYDLAAVAADYAQQSHFQPPEATILRLLLPSLPTAKMLDLGIGGGRTTVHFADKVHEYVGADYSERRITACRNRFAGCVLPGFRSGFVMGGQWALFEAGSFDFILFSHNGTDYVPHDEWL